jgi:membrane fusion protein (multidrug efflux system)
MTDTSPHSTREGHNLVTDSNLTPPSPTNATRRKGFLALGAVVLLSGAAYGAYALLNDHSEETDDAYIAGNVAPITARDPGTVIAVNAESTQGVKAGQVLVEFDPALADTQRASAEADLAKAVRAVRSGDARVNTADAEISQASVRLSAAKADLARREKAAVSGAISGEEVAHAREAVEAAAAALDLAQSHRSDARSTVDGTSISNNPGVLAAIAAVKKAAIAQKHLRLVAPFDGVVAQRAVQLGQQVAPGTPLMAVVALNKVWIDANFRETQLAKLRVGQPVSVHADAYGKDVTFHGKVVGLSAGSGSAFALLPAQNASGNWIKIVQRVPVRIALDSQELAAHPLRLGLSVKVSVDTSGHEGQPVTVLPAVAQPSAATDVPGADVDARIAQIIAANAGGAQR